jgi:hypothetical protein
MAEAAGQTSGDGVESEPWQVPASYAQERVWFASQIAGHQPVYHVVDEVAISSPISADDVLAALAVCTRRHETLRTSFRVRAGELMQAVHDQITPQVDVLDLSHLGQDEQRERVEELFAELATAPLALDQAPLWRATLIRLDAADWVVARWLLLFAAHHAIFDAASALNLRAELTELCAAAAQQRAPSLPELAIQYADYAVWQRNRLAAGRMDELLDYWRKALDCLPAVHGLPTDLPRPAERSFGGADLIFPLPDGAESTAVNLARQANATAFMVLFAAYIALLHLLSASDDIVIGLPVAGRDRPEVQPLIGMFVNMIVVRTDAAGDPTFKVLLDRVRHALLDAWDHQEMPFQKLVEVLADRRDPGVPPLYQLGFNFISVGFSRASAAAEDDLMLEISRGRARVEYNTALFTEGTARWLADCYVAVLGAVLANPQAKISELAVPARPQAQTHHAGAGPARPGAASAHVPPRTAAEELVANVWAEVLGTDRPGALDDFFDLGGHSLLALRVIARLSAATGVDLPIQSFFIDTTVAGVAAEVERVLAAELDEMSDEEAARLAAGEGYGPPLPPRPSSYGPTRAS